MSRALLPRRRLPESGERVGDYEVVAPVAQGGMAEVFLVRRRGLGGFERRLAMKMMHPHLAGESAFVDMFLDEARIASCVDHPNVVKVLDVGSHDGLPWLVMEWLDGKTLADVLTHPTKPSIELRAAMLAEVATGLHAAHEARGADGAELGVVHRDVSPQNVHVGYDGVVKLVDFGIAAARGRLTRTETGQVKGKVGYLAPEQLLHPNEPVDRRVDVWAFGVMAWETLALRRLFGGTDPGAKLYQIVHAALPDLADAAPDVPEELADVVMQCLERNAKRRPATMSEIARSLRAFTIDPHAREAVAAHMTSCFAADRQAMEAQLEALRSARSGEVLKAEARRAHDAGRDADEVPTKVDVETALAAAEHTDVDASPSLAEPATPESARDEDARPAPARSRARVAGLAALGLAGIAAAIGWPLVAPLVREPAAAERAPIPAIAAAPAAPVAAPPPTALAAALPPDPAPAEVVAPATQVIEMRVARTIGTVRVAGSVHDERPVRIELPEGGSVEVELRARDGRRATRTVAAGDDGGTLELPRRRSRVASERPEAEGEGSLWGSPYR